MFSKVPPTGPLWVHEVKFDGYRLQIHKDGKHVVLYSKRGNDFTSSYPTLVSAVAKLPTKAVILDAELTICAPDGSPDSRRWCAEKPMAYASGSSTSFLRAAKTNG